MNTSSRLAPVLLNLVGTIPRAMLSVLKNGLPFPNRAVKGLVVNNLKTKAVCLFVALSLSVTYFYLIRPLALGRPQDKTNLWVFTAMSKTNPHLETIYPVWRSRVAGMWLSGKMVDSVSNNGQRQLTAEDIQDVFGAYQAIWMFLFLAMLIFLVEDPLFMIVACFGCIFYMLTPKAALYCYPWDIPAMLFFTLNYFLWRRGHYNAILVVMALGYLFKETIIVSGAVYLFADVPKWRKIQYFVATGIIAVIMKVAITLGVDGKISLFTNQVIAGSQGNWFTDSQFLINVRELADLKSLNHFIFVNGGTFMLSLFLPARTRIEKGTKALILAFAAVSLGAGALKEFRIMLDILPVSILALREYLVNPKPLASVSAAATKQVPKSAKGMR